MSFGWVPRFLTPAQKHTRLVMLQANLAHFETNPDSFLERFFTQVKCWFYHFEIKTKRQSMQWKHPSSPFPKKAKVVLSAEKVAASVFWDAKGIVFIDYLQKRRTINGEYYANLLKEMRQVIKSKRPGKLTKGVLFHQNKAPAHESMVAMASVRDCSFDWLIMPHIL